VNAQANPISQDERGGAWKRLVTGREEQVFLILTLVIGALVGLVVVAFILLTERFRCETVSGGSGMAAHLCSHRRGIGNGLTIVPVFSGCVGKRSAANVSSSVRARRKNIFGAGIASVLGWKLGLSLGKVKSLIPVGAAAAIAAAFNTPLEAVLFALEEIVGDLHAPVLGSVVLASATSWAVLRLLLGNHPLFEVPQYQLVNPAEFALYAVLGVAGGLVSVAFTRMLLVLREKFLAAPRKTIWFQPVAGGLLVGLIGWFVPQNLGWDINTSATR